MRRRPSPEDVISALYLDEGFYEVERSAEAVGAAAGRLVLSDGRIELAINILDEDSCSSKAALHDALLEAERLTDRFSGVALAVPRRFQKAVDEGVLARHGIGLVVYDMMGAEEVVPPKLKPREEEEAQKEVVVERVVGGEELASLRSEISRVLRVLEEFEARLDRLEREQRALAARLSRLEGEVRARRGGEKPRLVESVAQAPQTRSEKLPSFLRDNPWVDILSKRE